MTQHEWASPKYARNGDTHIGYATLGEGPPDLVQVGIAMSHLEFIREHPWQRRFHERLALFSRCIEYDRRGSGLSDRTVGPVPVEVEVEDLLAVLDAAGSERPYLYGPGAGGTLALVFAAVHPDRCSGVIAWSTPARFIRSKDYPYGWDQATFDSFVEGIEDGVFLTPEMIDAIAPSVAGDREFFDWTVRTIRAATTPRQLRDSYETFAQTDIRDILPSVQVPVLALHRTGDQLFSVEQSRDLAKRLHDARFVELPGDDWSIISGDTESVIAEMQAFVTGRRPIIDPDRQLATVLFTDVVSSTNTVSSIGDKRWREVLDRHDDIVSREIKRFGGQRIASTGDGVLATFSGPARGIRAAIAIRDALANIGVAVRAGLHTGEIECRGEDVAGIAVHIGKRVSDHAGAGEVLVSRTLPDLVAGSGLEFEQRGEHELKGVPGRWQLYAVTS